MIASTVSGQSNADKLFGEAKARETILRREIDTRRAGSPATPLLERARTLAGAYQDIARLFPKSPTGDDALWQGGILAADTFWEFGQAADRTNALRLFKELTTRYPTSALAKQAGNQTERLASAHPLESAPPSEEAAVAKTPPATNRSAVLPVTRSKPAANTLTAIRREALPDALRVTLAIQGEATFHDALEDDGTPRVFIDLDDTRPVDALKDVVQSFNDDVVREIRVLPQADARTRVVLAGMGMAPRTTYALYNPYRVVIDFARPAPAVATTPTAAKPASATAATAKPTAPPPARSNRATTPAVADATTPAPVAPAVNRKGGFSLSRQLGLGVARVVIDPGHGGHDPGALNDGLSEAELVLDVSLRLERLLQKQPGVDVVMTRRSNIFVPLEERTAIANREGADLFLSIHGNASEDDRIRGVETYFLNFAPNPAAEAIAARENAAAAGTMRQLPDIVKAIALNNKIDESRDFASLVHRSMLERLKRVNKSVKNLGVKQAPFMVLVGATMPSVLAEVSFLTNPQESTLLRSSAYRQQIAEALLNGIMRYQRSLKADAQTVASQ